MIGQTFQEFEIVAVDDASTDDSWDILKQLELEYPQIRIFKNSKNMNCGFTKNLAAQKARGDILGYLDPDDYLLPNALEVMVNAHKAHPEASIISSSHYVCDANLVVNGEAYGACKIPDNENYLTYGKGITAFATFKSKSYQLTPGIDPNFKRAVDQDLYLKLEEVGKTIYLPIVLYKYRVHAAGISSLKNMAKAKYWSLKAKESAFLRRLNQPHIKNITKKELRAWKSVMYSSRTGLALSNFQLCQAIYWFYKSIRSSPFDGYFFLKLRSMFWYLNPISKSKKYN